MVDEKQGLLSSFLLGYPVVVPGCTVLLRTSLGWEPARLVTVDRAEVLCISGQPRTPINRERAWVENSGSVLWLFPPSLLYSFFSKVVWKNVNKKRPVSLEKQNQTMKALGKTKNSQFGISSWHRAIKRSIERKITETSHKYLSLYNLPKYVQEALGKRLEINF